MTYKVTYIIVSDAGMPTTPDERRPQKIWFWGARQTWRGGWRSSREEGIILCNVFLKITQEKCESSSSVLKKAFLVKINIKVILDMDMDITRSRLCVRGLVIIQTKFVWWVSKFSVRLQFKPILAKQYWVSGWSKSNFFPRTKSKFYSRTDLIL